MTTDQKRRVLEVLSAAAFAAFAVVEPFVPAVHEALEGTPWAAVFGVLVAGARMLRLAQAAKAAKDATK